MRHRETYVKQGLWVAAAVAIFGAGYYVGTYQIYPDTPLVWLGVVLIVAMTLLACSLIIHDESSRVRVDPSGQYRTEYAFYIYSYLRLAEAVAGIVGTAVTVHIANPVWPFVLLYAHAITPAFWRASCNDGGPSIAE
jgi:hypothetical protein